MKESEKAEKNVDARAIIDAVLKHVGMKAPTFAKEIGINYQRIFDLTNGRTKKFNPGVVNLICERFPEINKQFLYTGEGEVASPVTETGGGSAQLSEMMSMYRQMMSMFQNLTEKESKLSELLAELNERERELNDREHELNLREVEIERVADELGIKKPNLRMQA